MKKEGLITKDDLLVIKIWIQEMKMMGPGYIQGCKYWNDHSLRGKRSGERASSFSDSGRIIYKVMNNKITIRVLKISPEHDYR